MGLGSVCCKLSAVLVAVLAIGIGLLASGGAKQMGLFAYLDGFKGARGAFFKGMFPANHEGTFAVMIVLVWFDVQCRQCLFWY